MYSLDGANYDLAEWIDERLEYITGMQGAEDATPQVQTVDILPVVHRLVCFLQNPCEHNQSLITGESVQGNNNKAKTSGWCPEHKR